MTLEPSARHDVSPAAPWRSRVNGWTWAFAGLFVLAALVMVMTFLDYGLTWDEEVQHIYGDLLLRWYSTLGEDRGAVSFANLIYYGGFFEVIAEAGARVLPFGVYEGRHLVNVLFGLAGVLGTHRLARLLDTPRAAFFSGAFLLLLPEYYGHSFNNPKDIPLAAVSIWAMVAIVKGAQEIPLVPWRSVAWTALALGLLLAVRVGSAFYFFYLFVAWAGALLLWHWNADTQTRDFLKHAARLIMWLGLVAAGAWLVMLIFWPYAQVKPIENPLRGIFVASRFGWDHPVRHMGADYPARELPRSYLLVQIAIRLPEYFYIALLCGAVAAIVTARRHRAFWTLDRRAFGVLLVGLGVLFPLALAFIADSTVYDGMRHFLFVLPLLAVLAGIGLSRFVDLAIARPWRLAGAAAAMLGAALVVWDMVALHPYQSVYFNRVFVGGLRGAVGRFETDYWGASYREAARWVFTNVPPPSGRRGVIKNCSMDFLSSYFIDQEPEWRAAFTGGAAGGEPDILLATERWECHKTPGKVLHVVRRQGAPLAYVIQLPGAETGDPPARPAPR